MDSKHIDLKHRNSFEINSGTIDPSWMESWYIHPGFFIASLGVCFFGATMLGDASSDYVPYIIWAGMVSGGLLYFLVSYNFEGAKHKLIVDKKGITITTQNRPLTKPVFVPLDTIDRVERLLYEKDGSLMMHSYFVNQRVPMIVSGLKRYPILLGASDMEREIGLVAINNFIQRHQIKTYIAEVEKVFSIPPRMIEIEQSLPRPPRGSKIAISVNEDQNVVIATEGKSLLELNCSGMTTLTRKHLYDAQTFFPITEIHSFELYERKDTYQTTRGGSGDHGLYTALRVNPWKEHIPLPVHVEETRWLQQYMTEFFEIIRENGMAQVVKVEKKKEPESDFEII